MCSCENLKAEVESFGIEIQDDRTNPDRFKVALENQLEFEGIEKKLIKISKFFGKYSDTDPKDLSIRLVDGKFGEGTIKNSMIEIQIPDTSGLVNETKIALASLIRKNTEQEKEEVSKKLILAVATSTILHEATHGLLDSKPGSKLAAEMEEILGIENIQGKFSTLLDEGITYAIQEIFASEIEPIGNVAPRINKNDREIVKLRKELGHKLKPRVENYLNHGKEMDHGFIKEAAKQLQETLKQSMLKKKEK